MDALSATFAALADPTRRSILAQLAKGDATVNDLAAPYAISLPSVSRHLKVLERAGLISKGRSAQWRPCRLEVAPLQGVEAWMEPYRLFFESRFDRLDEHLQTMVAEREDRPITSTSPTDPPNSAGTSAVEKPAIRRPARTQEPAGSSPHPP